MPHCQLQACMRPPPCSPAGETHLYCLVYCLSLAGAVLYCRREEELERYHKELEREVPLSMTPEFRYSDAFIKKGGGGGSRVLSGASGALSGGSGLDGSNALETGSSRVLGRGSGGGLRRGSGGDASIQ